MVYHKLVQTIIVVLPFTQLNFCKKNCFIQPISKLLERNYRTKSITFQLHLRLIHDVLAAVGLCKYNHHNIHIVLQQRTYSTYLHQIVNNKNKVLKGQIMLDTAVAMQCGSITRVMLLRRRPIIKMRVFCTHAQWSCKAEARETRLLPATDARRVRETGSRCITPFQRLFKLSNI